MIPEKSLPAPGAGKTTLAMQFLLAGVKKGETGSSPPGFQVGRQLRDFLGVLTGEPIYTGGAAPLLPEEGNGRGVEA